MATEKEIQQALNKAVAAFVLAMDQPVPNSGVMRTQAEFAALAGYTLQEAARYIREASANKEVYTPVLLEEFAGQIAAAMQKEIDAGVKDTFSIDVDTLLWRCVLTYAEFTGLTHEAVGIALQARFTQLLSAPPNDSQS